MGDFSKNRSVLPAQVRACEVEASNEVTALTSVGRVSLPCWDTRPCYTLLRVLLPLLDLSLLDYWYWVTSVTYVTRTLTLTVWVHSDNPVYHPDKLQSF